MCWSERGRWEGLKVPVEPFSGVIVTRGTLTTSAKGIGRWSKSASLWVGCEVGGESEVGGKAVLPDMKRNTGLVPRHADVTCVTIGSALSVR